MDYKIRTIAKCEEHLLEVFLYEAIFVPEGIVAPPKSMINQPELQLYITDFGKKKDNFAVKMYQKTGFEIVDENVKEYIMLCRL